MYSIFNHSDIIPNVGKNDIASNCATLSNELAWRFWLGCIEILKFPRVDNTEQKKVLVD